MKSKVVAEGIDFEHIHGILQQHLSRLQEQYHVKTLGIFGSYVRGETTKNSDLDLIVEFRGDLTFDKYMDLKFFLEELLNKKIDLVIKEDIKPQIREQILKETLYVS